MYYESSLVRDLFRYQNDRKEGSKSTDEGEVNEIFVEGVISSLAYGAIG